jgi:hypothetical protein
VHFDLGGTQFRRLSDLQFAAITPQALTKSESVVLGVTLIVVVPSDRFAAAAAVFAIPRHKLEIN